jgi:hypothetical protein
MASTAEIAALRVSLAMETAEFGASLNKASAAANAFASKVEGTFLRTGRVATAQLAALAAGVAAAFGPASMVMAVRNAINLADQTGKLASSLGMTSEALSRLEAAAGMSGLSTDNLRAGVTALVKSMGEAEDKTSGAARAFAAAGVATKDATGALRPANEVIADLAERFSTSADGVNKTRIALELLGKQGTAWVPLLNGGAQALKDIGDRADATGRTIETKTAKAAAQFNDTMTRLSGSATIFGLAVAREALPALDDLATKLERNKGLMVGLGEAVGRGITESVAALDKLPEAFAAIGGGTNAWAKALALARAEIEKTRQAAEGLKGFADLGKNLLAGKAEGEGLRAIKTAEQQKQAQDALNRALLEQAVLASPAIKSLTDLRNVQDLLMKDQLAYANMASPTMQVIKDALEAGKVTWQEYQKIAGDALNIQRQFDLDELNSVLDSANSTIIEKRAALDEALAKGAIGWRTYGKTVQDVEKANRDAGMQTLQMLGSTLQSSFGKNKAAAMAGVVISTAAGVMKALAQGGMWAWPQAALIAAAGAAQLATIRRTTMEGGSAPAPAPSGGSASTAAPQAPEAAAPPQTHLLEVHGLNERGMFSDEMVRSLVRRIGEFTRDGGRVVIAG